MTVFDPLQGFGLTAEAAAVPLVASAIPVGIHPAYVAVSPDEDHVYVTNSGSNTVSVIEANTRTVLRNPISFGNNPYGVAVTPWTGARSM